MRRTDRIAASPRRASSAVRRPVRWGVAILATVLMTWIVPAPAIASSLVTATTASSASHRSTTIKRDDAAALFAAARFAPADATLYLHLEDATEIRRRHGDRPIATALAARLGALDLDVARTWRPLAERAGVRPDTLFDVFFGRRISLIARPDGDRLCWAVLCDVDVAAVRTVLGRWEAEHRLPLRGAPVRRVPEASLRVALGSTWALVYGDESTELADDVLRRLRAAGGQRPFALGRPGFDAGPQDDDTLGASDGIAAGRTLGPGSLAAWFRHDPSSGEGWSALVGDLLTDQPGTVRLAHVAGFDAAPFERPPTALSWDATLVDRLGERFMAVHGEPTDLGGGRTVAWLERTLGVPLLDRSLAPLLGPRRLVVVDEFSAPHAFVVHPGDDPRGAGRIEVPGDAMVPAVAVVLEVRRGADVAATLDTHMNRLVRAVRRVAGDERSRFGGITTVNGIGEADLGDTLDRWWRGDDPLAAASPPFVQASNLSWTTVEGPAGQFLVIATHRGHLDDVGRLLAGLVVRGTEASGPWTSRGVVRGGRAAWHLRSLADAAESIAPPDDPNAADALQSLLRDAAELVMGMRTARWSLVRPDVASVRTSIEIDLADPPTRSVLDDGG